MKYNMSNNECLQFPVNMKSPKTKLDGGVMKRRVSTYHTERKPFFASRRQPFFASQRQPFFASQREPFLASQRKPFFFFESRREPLFAQTDKNQNVNFPIMKLLEDDPDDEVQFINNPDYFRWMRYLREPYKKQMEKKLDNVRKEMTSIYREVSNLYPVYNIYLERKIKENDGVICTMDPVRKCSCVHRTAVVCSLAIGKDEAGKFVVGLDRKSEVLEPLSMVVHNYAEHVAELAKVFQVFLEKTSTYLSGEHKFWDKLIVHTNSSKDIMLTVSAHCTEFLNDELKKKVISDLKEFFEEGEGKKCRVTTLYFRLEGRMFKINPDLIIGSPTIEDKVVGLKLHLLPRKMLWTSLYGAQMLCKAIKELLTPTKELSILEIGCETGIIGLYLSKSVGEVLSLHSGKVVETAEKNKELNNITNCTYFNMDDPQLSIKKVAAKTTLKSFYAIVILSRKMKVENTMMQLRNIKQLQKILLVVEMSMNSPLSAVLSLSAVGKSVKPFLPVRALTVDTMPNSKGHILLLLLERIDIATLPGGKNWKLMDSKNKYDITENGRKQKAQNFRYKTIVPRAAQFHDSVNFRNSNFDKIPNNRQEKNFRQGNKKRGGTQRRLKNSQPCNKRSTEARNLKAGCSQNICKKCGCVKRLKKSEHK